MGCDSLGHDDMVCGVVEDGGGPPQPAAGEMLKFMSLSS